MIRGRQFTDRDNTPPPRVSIINEAAARKFFPDDDPIGIRMALGARQDTVLRMVMHESTREREGRERAIRPQGKSAKGGA